MKMYAVAFKSGQKWLIDGAQLYPSESLAQGYADAQSYKDAERPRVVVTVNVPESEGS